MDRAETTGEGGRGEAAGCEFEEFFTAVAVALGGWIARAARLRATLSSNRRFDGREGARVAEKAGSWSRCRTWLSRTHKRTLWRLTPPMLAFMLSVFIVCIVFTAAIRNKSCLAGLEEAGVFGLGVRVRSPHGDRRAAQGPGGRGGA